MSHQFIILSNKTVTT